MAATDVRFELFAPEQVGQWHGALVDVYRDAFREPPYKKGENVVRQFESTLERHAANEGFRCVAALTGDGNGLIGFGYGYTSRRGQWWHDQVVRQLDAATAERWFGDAFEVVEFAVRTAMQGQGIGRRLHDLLLEPAPNRTAVLSTLDADSRGLHLYKKRGWQTIRSSFWFTGVREPYLIMGLELGQFRQNWLTPGLQDAGYDNRGAASIEP